MIDLITGVTQTFAAIAFALVFRNVWAIVASLFVSKTVRVWITYYLFDAPRHKLRFDRDIAVDLWRFSRVVGFSSALTLIIAQLDKLVLGRILTLSEFGVFVISSSLAATPTAFASKYASTIVYPAVASAWRDGESIQNAYYRCWGRFFYLYAFAAGGLIGASSLLVALLYDDRYLPAGTYLAILAVGTAMVIVTRAMESVQVASGRQRAAIEFNVLRLAWLGSAAAVALIRAEPIIVVLALGLMELPVYGFGLLKMARLGQVRVAREVTFIAAVGSGILVGWGVKEGAFVLLSLF
jgi:O-antigen/teichoic acid export membrane protein